MTSIQKTNGQTMENIKTETDLTADNMKIKEYRMEYKLN